MTKNFFSLTLVMCLTLGLSGCSLIARNQAASTEAENEGGVPTGELLPMVSPESIETAGQESGAENTDEEGIKEAFSLKYNRPVAEINITTDKMIDNRASGGVIFSGEMGGGWWLAAKEEGTWKIVADGNGAVMCADVEPYNFPVAMVPECWDEATSQLIKF